MRSAFIEVLAIHEDLNARRRKGQYPENRCNESALFRWHDAIAALAECLLRNPPGWSLGEGRAERFRIPTILRVSYRFTVDCWRE